MTRRTNTNLVVDCVAFGTFVLLTVTGLIERYVLPPGTGRFWSLWGLDRHQWGEIHFWIALVLMAVLAIHVFLHWKWIVCAVRNKKTEASGWRFAFGLVGIVGLVGLSLAPFLAGVEQSSESRRGRQREIVNDEAHSAVGERIRGSMTLIEVERATGVPATEFIREFRLPADLSHDEQLGRLANQFGFELDEVRNFVRDRSPNSGTNWREAR